MQKINSIVHIIPVTPAHLLSRTRQLFLSCQHIRNKTSAEQKKLCSQLPITLHKFILFSANASISVSQLIALHYKCPHNCLAVVNQSVHFHLRQDTNDFVLNHIQKI